MPEDSTPQVPTFEEAIARAAEWLRIAEDDVAAAHDVDCYTRIANGWSTLAEVIKPLNDLA